MFFFQDPLTLPMDRKVETVQNVQKCATPSPVVKVANVNAVGVIIVQSPVPLRLRPSFPPFSVTYRSAKAQTYENTMPLIQRCRSHVTHLL